MLYRVTHTTSYVYDALVSFSQNLLHLTARNGPHQVCRKTNLFISPQPAGLSNSVDYFGNTTTNFTLQEPHNALQVTATNFTEVYIPAYIEPAHTPAWETVRDQLRDYASPDCFYAFQFLFDSMYIHRSEELLNYALPSFTPCRPILEALLDFNHRINSDFQYDKSATTMATTLSEVFSLRSGVCQDFAHLQIACLRSLGLAARYVSGYLRTTPPAGRPRLKGADASHAWVSVFCPGNGWIDVDPTNRLIPGNEHIALAWGRDYDDVSPIKGIIVGSGKEHSVQVQVDVEEIALEEIPTM